MAVLFNHPVLVYVPFTFPFYYVLLCLQFIILSYVEKMHFFPLNNEYKQFEVDDLNKKPVILGIPVHLTKCS